MVDETASYAFNLDTVWTTKGEIQKLKECAMANEMIERVARAIFDADFPDKRLSWKLCDTESYYKVARIAIAAMREPTDKMINTGALARAADLKTKDIWNNMIDAALKE